MHITFGSYTNKHAFDRRIRMSVDYLTFSTNAKFKRASMLKAVIQNINQLILIKSDVIISLSNMTFFSPGTVR